MHNSGNIYLTQIYAQFWEYVFNAILCTILRIYIWHKFMHNSGNIYLTQFNAQFWEYIFNAILSTILGIQIYKYSNFRIVKSVIYLIRYLDLSTLQLYVIDILVNIINYRE
jgi:hypothetical protein